MNEKFCSILKTGTTYKTILLYILLFTAIGLMSACIKKPLLNPEPIQQLTQPQPTTVIEKDPQPQEEYSQQKVFLDLTYGLLSSSQSMNLYLPEGNGPFPLVFVIHGGGFKSGDKFDNDQLSKVAFLLKEGYAAASINYRLSDEAIYPAQIEDIKTAVRFMRANAKKFNLASDRFGAWGSSAGGTLAALLGTTCNVAELEGTELGFADQSSCVQATVDWFGLIDILKINKQFEGRDCPRGLNDADSADSYESEWVGAPIQTVPDLVFKTNPTNFIDLGDTPFLIQHGSEDCTVPPEQSRDFADALSAVIGKEKVIYSELSGAAHGGDQFKTEANIKLVGDFLNSFLK